MTTPFEWYSFGPIKSRNALISLVAGPPSIGKTYGMKSDLIEDAIRTGRQLMWLRRTVIELGEAKAGFFDSIAALHPGYEFRVDGKVGQVRMDGKQWRTLVRFAALTTSYQMRGTEFPLVDNIVYDECFTPLGVRYITDELERLMRLWITVNRSRVDRFGRAKTRLYMLGNAIELDNPYFLEWDFDGTHEWQKGAGTNGDVVLHLVDVGKYERRVSETIYGKAMSTVQIDYAGGEYFRSDAGYVVNARPADSKPLATLYTMRGEFGLWVSADQLTMYVTPGALADINQPRVAFEPMAVHPGIILADGHHFIRKTARRHYRQGSLFLVGQAAMPARQALAR